MHASRDGIKAEGKPEAIPVPQHDFPRIGRPIGVEGDGIVRLLVPWIALANRQCFVPRTFRLIFAGSADFD